MGNSKTKNSPSFHSGTALNAREWVNFMAIQMGSLAFQRRGPRVRSGRREKKGWRRREGAKKRNWTNVGGVDGRRVAVVVADLELIAFSSSRSPLRQLSARSRARACREEEQKRAPSPPRKKEKQRAIGGEKELRRKKMKRKNREQIVGLSHWGKKKLFLSLSLIFFLSLLSRWPPPPIFKSKPKPKPKPKSKIRNKKKQNKRRPFSLLILVAGPGVPRNAPHLDRVRRRRPPDRLPAALHDRDLLPSVHQPPPLQLRDGSIESVVGVGAKVQLEGGHPRVQGQLALDGGVLDEGIDGEVGPVVREQDGHVPLPREDDQAVRMVLAMVVAW